jgi:hypothetical protein
VWRGAQLVTRTRRCFLLRSNALKNHDQQRAYVEQLYGQVAGQWTSGEMTHALSGPAPFLAYAGLDQPPGAAVLAEPLTRNRIVVCLCLGTPAYLSSRGQHVVERY